MKFDKRGDYDQSSIGELRFMGHPIVNVAWMEIRPFQFTFSEPLTVDESVEISYAIGDASDPENPEFVILRFVVDDKEIDPAGIEMKAAAGVTITLR